MCNNLNTNKCCTLLKDIYTEHNDNSVHVDCLHEMFVSFVADYRRDEETHQKVLHTYTSLRNVLTESDGIFKSGCENCPQSKTI